MIFADFISLFIEGLTLFIEIYLFHYTLKLKTHSTAFAVKVKAYVANQAN